MQAIDTATGQLFDETETVVREPAPEPSSPPLGVSLSVPETFLPNEPFSYSASITYEGELVSLLWRPDLSAGWRLDSFAGNGRTDRDPVTGALIWLGAIPPSPINFTLTFLPPPSSEGTLSIQNQVEYQFGDQINPDEILSPSPPLTLNSAPPPPLNAEQSGPTNFRPNVPVTLSGTINYTGELISLLWNNDLPENWTLSDFSGDGQPELDPVSGDLVWLGQLPASPIQLSLTLIPGDLPQSSVEFHNLVEYQLSDQINPTQAKVKPTPLSIVRDESATLTATQFLRHFPGNRSHADITLTINTPEPLRSLLARPNLPEGWTIQDLNGPGDPEWNAATKEIRWSGQIPEKPFEIRYIAVRETGAATLQIDHQVSYQTRNSNDRIELSAEPHQLRTLAIGPFQRRNTPVGTIPVATRNDSYYILFSRHPITSEPTPESLTLGTGETIDLPVAATNHDSGFYFVTEYPIGSPADTDGDGIDDITEQNTGTDPLKDDSL